MRVTLCLMLMCCAGCYLSHGLREPPSDGGVLLDSSVDPPRERDSGRPDSGFDSGFDSSVRDSATAADAGECVLPVEAYPESGVCQPETGACITRCGTNQPCIVVCLRRDPICRACAVRNALACFNSTPCQPLYAPTSCCVVNMCALTRVDDILDVCTALACGDVIQAYADCAIADSRARCRREIADCGLPPTLLGF